MMFETYYQSVKPDIRSPFHCLTASVHYVLLQKGLRCIGMNEELFTTGTIPSTTKSSELLPEDWNKNDKKVSLIYHQHRSKYYVMLKAQNAGEVGLLHLMKNTSDKVEDLSVSYKDFIGKTYAKYDEAYTNLHGLLELIEKRLVDRLLNEGRKKEASPQGTPSQPRPPTHPPSHPHSHFPSHPNFNPPHHPILPCGRSDLDPLAALNPPSGGMMFDPLAMYGPRHRQPPNINPSHFPPGSVPPGARFDPLDPFSAPGGHFGPDPDHMPRPDFDDPFNF